jgi:hypothetical protein
MKLSNVMFTASILTMTLSTLILFFVSSEQEFWSEAVFTGYFSSVVYIAICCVADANGH